MVGSNLNSGFVLTEVDLYHLTEGLFSHKKSVRRETLPPLFKKIIKSASLEETQIVLNDVISVLKRREDLRISWMLSARNDCAEELAFIEASLEKFPPLLTEDVAACVLRVANKGANKKALRLLALIVGKDKTQANEDMMNMAFRHYSRRQEARDLMDTLIEACPKSVKRSMVAFFTKRIKTGLSGDCLGDDSRKLRLIGIHCPKLIPADLKLAQTFAEKEPNYGEALQKALEDAAEEKKPRLKNEGTSLRKEQEGPTITASSGKELFQPKTREDPNSVLPLLSDALEKSEKSLLCDDLCLERKQEGSAPNTNAPADELTIIKTKIKEDSTQLTAEITSDVMRRADSLVDRDAFQLLSFFVEMDAQQATKHMLKIARKHYTRKQEVRALMGTIIDKRPDLLEKDDVRYIANQALRNKRNEKALDDIANLRLIAFRFPSGALLAREAARTVAEEGAAGPKEAAMAFINEFDAYLKTLVAKGTAGKISRRAILSAKNGRDVTAAIKRLRLLAFYLPQKRDNILHTAQEIGCMTEKDSPSYIAALELVTELLKDTKDSILRGNSLTPKTQAKRRDIPQEHLERLAFLG